jgi:hypothetical protein
VRITPFVSIFCGKILKTKNLAESPKTFGMNILAKQGEGGGDALP